MNARILVYSVLVVDILTLVMYLFIPSLSTLANLDLNTIASSILIMSVLVTILWLIGIVGLFLFKHWGRICYLISFILGTIALTQFPDFISLVTTFDILSIIVSLLVLCVVFGPASKEFK